MMRTEATIEAILIPAAIIDGLRIMEIQEGIQVHQIGDIMMTGEIIVGHHTAHQVVRAAAERPTETDVMTDIIATTEDMMTDITTIKMEEIVRHRMIMIRYVRIIAEVEAAKKLRQRRRESIL